MTSNIISEFRVVPDTNIIIASKKNPSSSSPNVEFIDRWARGEFLVLYCIEIIHEYKHKLLQKGVKREIIEEFLEILKECGELIYLETFHERFYPDDPKDIPFILCSVNGKATHLVTYDPHLLRLKGKYEFEI